jgi:lipopolysaccharide/colanic/teichoic acid biosynthesis glycosyltransferase
VLVFFLLTAFPFLKLVGKNDPKILPITIPLLFIRAGALGFGLLAGFLFPPRLKLPTRTGLNFIERFFKRLLDVVAAVLGLLIFSPIMLIAALLIRLDSPGKAIFKQTRVGEGGKPFTMYKLRTMVKDAPEKLEAVLQERNIDLAQPAFKIQDDPRVTRVGSFLRKTSLDEVPQFWNILRGEMSMVGPRPEEAWLVEMYNDHQRQRLVVKPGLTGPMQVNGRGDLDMESRLEIELDYIQHYSFWLDVKILLQSIGVWFTGKGAY